MADKRRPGNPNWRRGWKGGGPKHSKLQIAVRDDPASIDRLVESYLAHRDMGYSVLRAENEVLRDMFGVSTQTMQRWRIAAIAGEPTYAEVWARLAAAEKEKRKELFEELDPKLKEQPYKYLEKRYHDWGDSLNQEAVESAAQEIAGDKLTLVAQKVEELAKANPDMSAAELVTAAVEHLAEVR